MTGDVNTGGGAPVGRDANAGGDFVGRDSARQVANVNVPLTGAERDEWIVAQLVAQNERLARMDGKLSKLDQIDDALTGNRLYGRVGLVADVHRLWQWIVAIVIVLVILAIAEAAQWYMIYHIWFR